MDVIPSLGLFTHRSQHLAHLAILLKPLQEPSTFESLPTEIITHIAQIAQDTYLTEGSPIARDRSCPCCGKASTGGKHAGVAKEVLALGGTSRRIRAVLVHAGFFRTISRRVKAEELFATSVVATEGFLSNADIVALHLDFQAPRNERIDTANLRRALDLYTGAEHMYIEWDTRLAAPCRELLPPLPPTRSTIPADPEPSNLRTLLLSLTELITKHGADDIVPSSNDHQPQPLIVDHLRQLLPVVASPGLTELDVTMTFADSDIAVRDGFSVFVDSLSDMRWEGLTRLGFMGYYDVDDRKQVSENWLPALENLLTLAPRLSPTLEDLEVTLNVRISRSSVFNGTTNEPSLPGLIPLRDQIEELLQRLAEKEVEIKPFSIAVTSVAAVLPVSPTLLLIDYVPKEYNTPETRKRLPKRMQGIETPPFLKSEAVGGDELRFAVNVPGLEDIFVDVLGVERIRDATAPLDDDGEDDMGPMVLDMDPLDPMPMPLRAMFEEMVLSVMEEFDQ